MKPPIFHIWWNNFPKLCNVKTTNIHSSRKLQKRYTFYYSAFWVYIDVAKFDADSYFPKMKFVIKIKFDNSTYRPLLYWLRYLNTILCKSGSIRVLKNGCLFEFSTNANNISYKYFLYCHLSRTLRQVNIFKISFKIWRKLEKYLLFCSKFNC